MAGTGPIPIIEGSTPASAYPVKVAKIGKFNVLATSLVVKIKAAAPSLIPEEFPAVTIPSVLKTGLNELRDSTVVSGRILSSLSIEITCFIFLFVSSIGVISLLKVPLCCAW